MKILEQKDFKPDVINNDGKTFLELSPIHQKLLQRINTAPDDWAINTFFGFIANENIFVSWINLGDDRLFEAILIRIRQILSLSSFKKPVSKLVKSKQSLQFLYLEQFFKRVTVIFKPNVHFISYLKCSNLRQISKLSSNFRCLSTFCCLDGANASKTDLHKD